MQHKILIAEAATGIILTSDAKARHLKPDLPYTYFDTLTEAIDFATSLIKNNDALEVGIWDYNDIYKTTITAKTL